MSTFQGTTFTGYESISPYRLYLDLSMDDREFTSGVKNPLVYSEESTNISLYSTLSFMNSQPTNGGDTSTYGMIRNDNRIQQFREFIDKYDLQYYMNGDFTLFVPVDKLMGIIDDKLQTTSLNALDIFNYHKLDYVLLPIQIFDRKIRLQTKLRNQYILVSNTSIISETSDRNPNRILSSIKTDNGYIYIIEQPLIPYVI